MEIKNWPTTDEIYVEALKIYPLDDPRKNMHHDNYGQYSRQDAFKMGVQWLKSQLLEPAEEKSLDQLQFEGEIANHYPTPPQPVKEEYDAKQFEEMYQELHRDFSNFTDWEISKLVIKFNKLKSSSFSTKDMEGFPKYVNDNFYYTKSGKYKHKGAFNDPVKEKDKLTISQLLTEYLSSPEYLNRK